MTSSFNPLLGERSTHFSEDGLAIILFPITAGQPAKFLRHTDGLLRAYVFADDDAQAVRELLRAQGNFSVQDSRLIVRSIDGASASFAIPAHDAASRDAGVLGGDRTKTLRRVSDADSHAQGPS